MNRAEVCARRTIPLLVAGLILLGCSGNNAGTRSASPPPTGAELIALAPYAQGYAAVIAPVEGAVAAFASASSALPIGASVRDFVVIARPLTDVIAKVDAGLRQVTWPAAALHDIKSELAADHSLRDDLQGTLDVTLILAVWRHQIVSAANKVRRIQRLVSIDLGLVPLSG